jgi:Rrf2 family transcriptional regulator, iron-sulfur cluster assembly transcription factor
MMLTTKGRYAVMALVDIASRNRFIEVQKATALSDIAESQGITVAYLEQIFSKLKNAGIVKSQRGPGGGYILARGIGEIRISEIINAAEEEIKMTRCGGVAKACTTHGKGKCVTHDLWDGLSETIEGYLSSVTLEDVVSKRLGNRLQVTGEKLKEVRI